VTVAKKATPVVAKRAAPAAALYLRISSDRNGDELGIDRQREDCTKLAKARGWDVAATFVDNDVSAYSGRTRPGYERLLEAVNAGTVTAVISWHPDRLHRSPVELERFIDVIETTGAQVATCQTGDLDLSSASGRMTARVVGAVARHESEQKSERVRRQREQMAMQGRPHGGRRPYGYDPTGTKVVKPEAKMIREAARRVTTGESLRAIAIDWNTRGVPSSSGKPWSVTSLKSMIAGPRIAALRVHQGEVVGPASWPAILTRDEHDRIRAILGNPRVHRVGRPALSLLGGLLVCSECGAKMHHSTRVTGVRRYLCVVRPENGGCGHVAIQAERLEDIIVETVMRRLDTPALAAATAAPKRAKQLDDVGVLEARLGELADTFAAGEVTRAEWLRARSGIEERLVRARRAQELETGMTVLAPYTEAGVLRDRWPALTTDQRRTILSSVLDRVVIGPAKVGGRFDPDRIAIGWRA
jgi:DNA invertase Pin-like site-specific DNA recombinase